MIVSGILCEKCFTGFAKCLLQTRHLVKPTTMMRMVCAWFQWCASFAHECTHFALGLCGTVGVPSDVAGITFSDASAVGFLPPTRVWTQFLVHGSSTSISFDSGLGPDGETFGAEFVCESFGLCHLEQRHIAPLWHAPLVEDMCFRNFGSYVT